MTDQKLNLNINLGEIRYSRVPDIRYWLQISSSIRSSTTDPIDWMNNTDIFAVANCKTRDTKIPLNFGLIKLPYFYDNFTSFFLTKSFD